MVATKRNPERKNQERKINKSNLKTWNIKVHSLLICCQVQSKRKKRMNLYSVYFSLTTKRGRVAPSETTNSSTALELFWGFQGNNGCDWGNPARSTGFIYFYFLLFYFLLFFIIYLYIYLFFIFCYFLLFIYLFIYLFK
jgi:hypothetical protein